METAATATPRIIRKYTIPYNGVFDVTRILNRLEMLRGCVENVRLMEIVEKFLVQSHLMFIMSIGALIHSCEDMNVAFTIMIADNRFYTPRWHYSAPNQYSYVVMGPPPMFIKVNDHVVDAMSRYEHGSRSLAQELRNEPLVMLGPGIIEHDPSRYIISPSIMPSEYICMSIVFGVNSVINKRKKNSDLNVPRAKRHRQ